MKYQRYNNSKVTKYYNNEMLMRNKIKVGVQYSWINSELQYSNNKRLKF